MISSIAKIRNFGRLQALLGLALLLLTLANSAPARARGDVLVVVASKDGSIEDISLAELRQLYLGWKLSSVDGSRILPLNRGNKTAERTAFDQSVLNMSPDKAARYWIDRRIRGESGSPKSVDPAPLVQKVVAKLPGAIAYVRESQLTSLVRVVRVEGKLPSDSGYPITE